MTPSVETMRTISFWLVFAYMFHAYIYIFRETLRLSKLSASGTRFTRMLSTPFWRNEKIKRELGENEVLKMNADKTERKMYVLGGIGVLGAIANVLINHFTR